MACVKLQQCISAHLISLPEPRLLILHGSIVAPADRYKQCRYDKNTTTLNIVKAYLCLDILILSSASFLNNSILFTEESLKTRDIYYAEILGRNLMLHTVNGSRQYVYTMNNFEKLVEDCGFFRCHKSFLVNMNYLSKIGFDNIILTNAEQIPLSKYRRKELLDAFGAFVGNH